MKTITKKSVFDFYLEFRNNWLTIASMAEYYELPEMDCKYLVELGKKYFEDKDSDSN